MKEYEVIIGGLPHTVQLDDDEAKRMGDAAKPAKGKARTPHNKQASKPANK